MDVKKVATLAHLEITDEEVAMYTPQMAEIVKYVEQLNELDTEDVEPMLGGLTDEGAGDSDNPRRRRPRIVYSRGSSQRSTVAGRGTLPGAESSMTSVVGGQWSVVSMCGRICCLLLSAACLLACSVPNLGEPDCEAARVTVREFYSFHFGNDMTNSAENLEKRRQFLTPGFYEQLKGAEKPGDPFTLTDDPPKAFRVGECEVSETGVRFDVLLFWKTDTRSEQRSIKVLAENVSDKWLIGSVTP